MNNKRVFKAVDNNGNDVELAIKRPTPKQSVDAQLVYNKEWFRAQASGSPLRINLDTVLEQQGLWGESQRDQLRTIENEVRSLEKKLRSGAKNFTSLENAREAALRLRELRAEWINLVNSRNALNQYSAENIADAARLQYLVSVTVVDNTTGRPYFADYEDFVARLDDKIAETSYLEYLKFSVETIDEASAAQDQYEDKWLKRYKFADEKGRLINKDGKLIDSEGRLINENGEYVTETGARCDKEGTLITPEGEYDIEYVEFDGV
jgi:hypothetical protein